MTLKSWCHGQENRKYEITIKAAVSKFQSYVFFFFTFDVIDSNIKLIKWLAVIIYYLVSVLPHTLEKTRDDNASTDTFSVASSLS